MTSLNIDVDDFTYTYSHKWDSRLTLSQWVSWLLNPHHPYFFLGIVCLILSSTLGYTSDFKNSKKSVSPYVSGFRFRFPPYGPLFGRSVLLQYLQHLFSPFRSYCTPWQPSNSQLHQPALIVSAITIYKSLHRLLSSSTHIIRACQVLFYIEHLFYFIYE